MKFGAKLLKLRREHDMTQKDLAKILDVTDVSVSNFENNKRNPDVTTLKKISRHFGVSLDYLVFDEDEEANHFNRNHNFVVPVEDRQYQYVSDIFELMDGVEVHLPFQMLKKLNPDAINAIMNALSNGKHDWTKDDIQNIINYINGIQALKELNNQ